MSGPMTRSLLVASSGGSAVPFLDLSTGGTFARALGAFYFTQAPTTGGSSFLSVASTGVRRIEDRGDGNGASLLMEKSATNRWLRSRDLSHASWAKFGAPTTIANAGPSPDGTTSATRVVGASASVQVYQSITSGRGIASVYSRSVAGTTAVDCLLYDGTNIVASGDASVSTTYRRIITPSLNNSITGYAVDTFDRSGNPPGIGPAATDQYIDLVQVEGGYYPTSPIVTTSAAVTRPADTLSYASGSYPPGFLTAGFVIEFCPDASSSERAAEVGETWYLAGGASGSGDGLIWSSNGDIILDTAAADEIFATGLTWDRGQKLKITVRIAAGEMTIEGATTGDGTYTGGSGTPWTPGGSFYVGNDSTGSAPVTGRYVGARITQAV